MYKKTVEPLDGHIGQRLRAKRNDCGMSLDALAELIDVTPQQMSRYELGSNRISAAQLYRLARGLNVNVGWFFEGFEENESELARVATVLREDRGMWTPQGHEDREVMLLDAYRRLPSGRVQQRFLALLEQIALDV